MVMKRICFLVAFSVLALSAKPQLLYEVSGNGLERPSYILGTLHFADASFLDSIPGLYDAFDNVEQVCGEIEFSKVNHYAVALKSYRINRLPSGMELSDCFTPEEFEEVAAYFLEHFNMDLADSLQYNSVRMFSPAVLTSSLEKEMIYKVFPTIEGGNLIDEHMQIMAVNAGKDVAGLESWEAQLDALSVASGNWEFVKKMLLAYMRSPEGAEEEWRAMSSAYMRQDIDDLEKALVANKEGEYGCPQEAFDAVFKERNLNWVGKMPGIMDEKPTLFVVGAGHLVGDSNVLSLLEKAGYDVRAY